MNVSAKVFVVGLVSSVTFAVGAAPAAADVPLEDFSSPAAAVQPVTTVAQQLDTTEDALAGASIDSVLQVEEDVAKVPHGYDVDAAIELAKSEIGTSRPTGWNAPGECIMSAQRWVKAGNGAWTGSGDPVANYTGATRMTLSDAEPGDIIQYEYTASPTSWVTGVHTVLITEVNDDGTFTIIQSNSPGGSGLVTEETDWTPAPPEGFTAAVWRF
ncbi:lipase [Leucobacter sp. USCH14]|uniref:CHAP domain-containing protein n=1 Tax=Leucobacter sp. USCH14 TaxID=3024838 RepID=UPI00309A093F